MFHALVRRVAGNDRGVDGANRDAGDPVGKYWEVESAS
jgi:hypothetical protein